MQPVDPCCCSRCGERKDATAPVEWHEYGGRPFCYGCLKTTLLHDVFPAVVAIVEREHEVLRFQPTEFVARRLAADVPDPVASLQPVESTASALFCPACSRNARTSEFCTATDRPTRHDVWECDQCHLWQLGSYSCARCAEMRVWYCSQCTTQNCGAFPSCVTCGGTQRCATLDEVAVAMALRDAGVGLDESARDGFEAQQAFCGRKNLDLRLSHLGMDTVPVSDDGNCLFEALAFQLFRCRSLHRMVRLMLAEYIFDEEEPFGALLGEEKASYAARMRRDREWGDEYCLLAAALLFRVSIHVVTSDERRWHVRFLPNKEPVAHCFLAYVRGIHYVAIIPRGASPAETLIDIRNALTVGPASLVGSPDVRAPSCYRMSPAERAASEGGTEAYVAVVRVSGAVLIPKGTKLILSRTTPAALWYVHPRRSAPRTTAFILQHVVTGSVVSLREDNTLGLVEWDKVDVDHSVLSQGRSSGSPLTIGRDLLVTCCTSRGTPFLCAKSTSPSRDTKPLWCDIRPAYDYSVSRSPRHICYRCSQMFDPMAVVGASHCESYAMLLAARLPPSSL